KVIYAVSTNTSIGALFVAGLLPGTLLTIMLCTVTWYLARKNNYPRMQKATWGESVTAFRQSIWGLMLVVIIIGGIYSGIFTATEAAAMSAVYAFFVAVYVYKEIGLKDVPRVLLRSANMSAMLLYIITNAVLFSFVLANENIPNALADWLLDLNLGWIGFLLVVNLLLLVAGNFMEPSSIILIMAPILFPTAMRLGIDPVPFGILSAVTGYFYERSGRHSGHLHARRHLARTFFQSRGPAAGFRRARPRAVGGDGFARPAPDRRARRRRHADE